MEIQPVRGTDKYPNLEKVCNNLNCYRTLFILLGLLSEKEAQEEECVQDRSKICFPKDYAVEIMSENSYQKYNHFKELKERIKTEIGDSLGVIQIGKVCEYGFDVIHTVLCGEDSVGRIICFEKKVSRSTHLRLFL